MNQCLIESRSQNYNASLFLRKKIDFLNVHGIVNTSVIEGLTYFQRDPSIHDSMNRPKLKLLLIF